MDKILINKLEVFGVHGLIPAEKLSPQKFIVSCECFLDSQKAGKTDNVDYTENYHKISDIIFQAVSSSSFNLLETIAEDCALKVLTGCPNLKGLKLKIEKPWVHSVKNIESFGVEIERKWHDVFIGLKAGFSNGEEAMANASAMLNMEDTMVEKMSSIVNSENSAGLSCVLKLKTLLNLDELDIFCKGVEKEFSSKDEFDTPETSDESEIVIENDLENHEELVSIKILLYDDVVTSDEYITVPDYEIFENKAFIKAISEISPLALEPLSRKRFIELCNEDLSVYKI